MIRALTFILCYIAIASGSSSALAQTAETSSEPAVRPPHKFLDAANIALTVAESGALVADGVYTQRILTRYPGWGREADPIARPFVNAGWDGQIVGGLLVVGADVGIRYLLHRKGHHTIERFVPLILIAYGSAGAVHNARELRRAKRGW